MDAPNLDTPVFVRIVDAELLRSLDHGDYGEVERDSDNINIVRYRSVEPALLAGHVELVM
jgi:DNA replication complex GINS protein SLD5 C-terminus